MVHGKGMVLCDIFERAYRGLMNLLLSVQSVATVLRVGNSRRPGARHATNLPASMKLQ